jgi:hypothetical protein
MRPRKIVWQMVAIGRGFVQRIANESQGREELKPSVGKSTLKISKHIRHLNLHSITSILFSRCNCISKKVGPPLRSLLKLLAMSSAGKYIEFSH